MDPARRRLLAALSFSCVAPLADWMTTATADEPETASYHLVYTHSPEDLIGDLWHGERGEWQRQSETPHVEWYSRRIRERFGAWGPRARRYLALPDLAERPLNWKQERVIASAARFIGYGYQHHHIPDWEPPADWPWKETCVGRNGKGFDCSNFTSFVYNQSFGIHMSSAVDRQAQLASAGFGRDGTHAIRRIDLPTGYRERIETLQTGDLLYIRGRQDGPVTHVVLWVGNIGRSPSGVPLVLDSHGGGVDDDAGQPIACGVHLRPFREKSWYHRCASHAHRLFA